VAEYWNTVVTPRLVLATCDRMGVAAEPILEAAGIDLATLADPSGRVREEQMRLFWAEAIAQSGDRALGLHAAGSIPRGSYGILDYLVGYSATIGEGLTRWAHYVPTINTWLATTTEVDAATGRLQLFGVADRVPRPSAEFVAGLVVGLGHRTWQLDFAPQLVRFEFPEPQPPEQQREHSRTLGCAVEFDAPVTEIVLSRETWDMAVRASDPGLVALLEKQANSLIDALPPATGFVGLVRSAVEAALAGGDHRLEAVAAHLAMSPRTLQRRLAGEGTTFNHVVDEVRQESAKLRLTDHGLSVAEVGYLVGFEEQSSFTRAFKRWTGVSPREYRRRLDAG